MLARSINIQREIQIGFFIAEALLLVLALMIIIRWVTLAPQPKIQVQAQEEQTVLVSMPDETLLARAEDSFKRGQYAESIVLLDAVIEIADKPTATMFATRALAHSRLAAFAEATRDYQEAIARNQNNVQYYTGICYTGAQSRNFNLATQGCDVATTMQPDNWLVWNERCYLRAYYTGDYDGAVSDCTQAITLNPNHPYPYNNRARAYLMRGNYTEAIADASRSIDLGNQYPAYPLTTRGTAYTGLGNFNQGMLEYQTALEVNATYPELHLRLGEWYRYQNQGEMARRSYCRYIELERHPGQYAYDQAATFGGCG